jgi:ATP-dependent Lon protease
MTTVVLPKANRKDLREIPRRVLKSLRIILVDHMDDVLRHALVLDDPRKYFGERRLFLEYRNGELWERNADGGSMRPGAPGAELLPGGVPGVVPGDDRPGEIQ